MGAPFGALFVVGRFTMPKDKKKDDKKDKTPKAVKPDKKKDKKKK